MPELAEVEHYRRRWECGVGHRIKSVTLHGSKRIFRGVPPGQLERALVGTVLLRCLAKGKQLLFQFSGDNWLGLHLGMTGRLSVNAPDFQPGKHDHLVLYQRERSLIFTDPRLFGRVRFQGGDEPDWWRGLPPAIGSSGYTRSFMEAFLQRHGKLPVKAALLLQDGFPGVGNWMADEVLWRAKVNPRHRAGRLAPAELERLWKELRYVCRIAVKTIAPAFGDPPTSWLFHERWSRNGRCPFHRHSLSRASIGGRTTAWCERCLHQH